MGHLTFQKICVMNILIVMLLKHSKSFHFILRIRRENNEREGSI